jgi:hypothetical protein
MTDKATPAFPTVMIGEREGGMTLRDYFAAKAMQGFAANLGPTTFQSRANLAYQWADAMMKARTE